MIVPLHHRTIQHKYGRILQICPPLPFCMLAFDTTGEGAYTQDCNNYRMMIITDRQILMPPGRVISVLYLDV